MFLKNPLKYYTICLNYTCASSRVKLFVLTILDIYTDDSAYNVGVYESFRAAGNPNTVLRLFPICSNDSEMHLPQEIPRRHPLMVLYLVALHAGLSPGTEVFIGEDWYSVYTCPVTTTPLHGFSIGCQCCRVSAVPKPV